MSVLAMAAMGAPAAPLPPTGAVTITSEPSGAPVTIDGEARGSTPLTTAVTAGSHVVEVGAGTGVRRPLQVTRGGDMRMHVQWQLTPESPSSIAPAATGAQVEQALRTAKPHSLSNALAAAVPVATGWLTVTSPFLVQILDDGREVGTSASAHVALPAGDHTLRTR